MPTPVATILLSFAIALALIHALCPIATKLNLVDKPDERKRHNGQIPLVGGIAIFLTLLVVLGFEKEHYATLNFLAAGAILVITGVVDDRFGLNVKLRIVIEMFAASIMVFGAGLWVGNLGNLFGIGEIHMPFWLGYPFTLIAVFGVINAFNMIDGMDGIAGMITLAALITLMTASGNSPATAQIAPIFSGALFAYLICNLKLLPYLPKIFLGDAGSKLIGLTLVWFIIDTAMSGGPQKSGISPATALYIVALPLFDMVTTTVRRLRKGKSPFHPDRTHIHHILQRAGFSKITTTAIIVLLAVTLNALGVMLNRLDTPEILQFALFMALFLLYSYNIHHAWRLSKRLKKRNQAKGVAEDQSYQAGNM